MDIFLNQLIQFYSNNATTLHHLTTHSTTCWPTKWRSHCGHSYVASLYLMYGAWLQLISILNGAKLRNVITIPLRVVL